MAAEKKFGTVKRFGPRYGRTSKEKLAKVEKILKGKHKCPYCHSWKAKRLSSGIWHCKKCNTKFTGKAYSVKKKVRIDEEIEKKKEEPFKKKKKKEEVKK